MLVVLVTPPGLNTRFSMQKFSGERVATEVAVLNLQKISPAKENLPRCTVSRSLVLL